MRRTLLSLLIGLCLGWPALAQDPNPQSSFATTLLYANPSLYLNFNDATTAFKDQISGQSFVGTATPSSSFAVGALPPSYIGDAGATCVIIMPSAVVTTGNLSSFTAQYPTAPSSGQILVIGTFDRGSGLTFTLASSFQVTVATTTSVQTFISGTNYSPVTVNAGQYIGVFTGSGELPGYGTGSMGWYQCGLESGNCGSPTTIPTGAQTYSDGTGWGVNLGFTATITSYTTYTSGTVTPRQPGFDSTLANNTSAEFAWNAWSAAPNNTLGAVDWSSPWTMMLQVDRLNWNRTGRLVLASKGDVATGSSWQLYLQTTADTTYGSSGQVSQLCFERKSASTSFNLGGGPLDMGVCTSSTFDAMPNGYNYNIVVEDNGNGNSGSATYGGGTPALSLWLNGLGGNSVDASSFVTSFTSSYQNGFGDVAITLSGGSGYADNTAFASSGGGANCVVTGAMTASGGTPNGITLNGGTDHGCTSVPTINLTSPSGTGVTITVTLGGSSMNSTAYPVMVPGFVSGGAYYGVAGTTSTQTSTYIDEFAIFPGNLNQTQVQGLFYWTKFYQSLLGAAPANRAAFIFDDDGCGDEDNFWALQGAIAADRAGYIKLEGIVQEDTGGLSAAIFRQMLDQAGYADVPMGVAAGGPADSSAGCTSANVTTYNASTSQSAATYPTAASVYRQVMAANPSTPVLIFLAGPLDGLGQFMESSADSTSPLTGMQLWDRDAANGALVYTQGGFCTPSSYPATSPCTGYVGAQVAQTADWPYAAYVYANNGSMPMIAVADTPQSSGPGPIYTRTSKDPMFLWVTSAGTDVRQGWDSLPMTAFITPFFTGGVTVGYSGGSGYADQTVFTSSGGGANCNVQGIMTASGGTPNGILTTWGAPLPLTDQNGQVVGLGHGCTSAPTLNLVSPTGTGVTLTAYLAMVCGTAFFTSTPSWSQWFNTTTCSNQYISPMSVTALPNQTPIFSWFLNSLIDPPPNGRPRW
jgi:hypothetical protein